VTKIDPKRPPQSEVFLMLGSKKFLLLLAVAVLSVALGAVHAFNFTW
jgi:hypothetical protein